MCCKSLCVRNGYWFIKRFLMTIGLFMCYVINSEYLVSKYQARIVIGGLNSSIVHILVYWEYQRSIQINNIWCMYTTFVNITDCMLLKIQYSGWEQVLEYISKRWTGQPLRRHMTISGNGCKFRASKAFMSDRVRPVSRLNVSLDCRFSQV